MIRPFSSGLLLAIASVPSAFANEIWYVDGSASPGGNGSVGAPFQTISVAVANPALQELDRIEVAPGVYDERFTLWKDVGIVSAAGPLRTVIRVPDASPDGLVVVGNARAKLSGFTVTGAGSFPSYLIGMQGGTLERCILLGPGGPFGGFATGVSGTDATTVRNCTITGFATGVTHPHTWPSPTVVNTIAAGNTWDLEATVVSFSCYGSGFGIPPNQGNIVGAPSWFDGPGRDLHLLPGSPCIDAGEPGHPFDPDGSRADIGALPFDAAWAPTVTYCTSKVNSLGCVPSIGSSGTASASSTQPFQVFAQQELNHKSGLLFWGFAPKNQPYQGGWLCVHAPLRRSALMDSGGSSVGNDCTGAFNFDFNAELRAGDDPQLTPGRVVYFQFWSRDGQASFNSHRTDALAVTLLP